MHGTKTTILRSLNAESRNVTHRVLVVDDEESIRLLLKEYLIILGLHATSAASGQEALEILKAEDYDLVLCDIAMPGLDGFQFFDRLKALKPLQKFIFISGIAFSDQSRRLLQQAHGVLRKPFHLRDLNTVLQRVFPHLDATAMAR